MKKHQNKMNRSSPKQPRGTSNLDTLNRDRKNIGRYSPSSTNTHLLPATESSLAEAKSISKLIKKYGILGVSLVVLLIIYRASRPDTTQTNDSHATPPTMSDLEFKGMQVMLDQVVHAYNVTHPGTAECFQSQFASTNSSLTVPHLTDRDTNSSFFGKAPKTPSSITLPKRPVEVKDVRALEQCRLQVEQEKNEKRRLSAMQYNIARLKSMGFPDDKINMTGFKILNHRDRTPLERHISFFSGEVHAGISPSAFRELLHEIDASTCSRFDFRISYMTGGMEQIWRIAKDSTCDWSKEDLPACFDHKSIEDKLSILNPDASNAQKGWMIYLFNRFHGGTGCPSRTDLPAALHQGSLRLYTPDGHFDEERFTFLLQVAQKVQGRNDIILSSTMTYFANLLHNYITTEPGTGREQSRFGYVQSKIQFAAAEASRDEMMSSSTATEQTLMASYKVIENGQEVTKSEPCIQSSLLRLFFENTPAYWETAKLTRREASSRASASVPVTSSQPEEDQEESLGFVA